MDSCNVMRGSKNGLEIKVRENLTSHSLVIDGDFNHYVHNVLKCFTKPFEIFLESWFSDIHTDFYYTSDSRELLTSFCDILSQSILKYQILPLGDCDFL